MGSQKGVVRDILRVFLWNSGHQLFSNHKNKCISSQDVLNKDIRKKKKAYSCSEWSQNWCIFNKILVQNLGPKLEHEKLRSNWMRSENMAWSGLKNTVLNVSILVFFLIHTCGFVMNMWSIPGFVCNPFCPLTLKAQPAHLNI